MRSRWNAKGDSVSSMVFWFGSTVATLICVAWLAKNLQPQHITLQQIDNELTAMQRDLNTACRMDTYWRNYYPKLNQGNLIITDLQICIDSSPCRVLYYSGPDEPATDEGDIMIEGGYPCENVRSCNALYYSSHLDPVFDADGIWIPDATICNNKHDPLQSCRLLMCSVNASEHIFLEGVTYINITKENGRISFEAQ